MVASVQDNPRPEPGQVSAWRGVPGGHGACEVLAGCFGGLLASLGIADPGPPHQMTDATFAPFRGLRYRGGLDSRTAPPYDVLDPEEASAFRARDPRNVVHLDLPVDVGDATAASSGGLVGTAEPDEGVRAAHRHAATLIDAWVSDGTLAVDPDPVFYLYRQGFRDASGRQRQTTGVVGALRIGDGGVRPHEETTKKASSDRLVSLEETRTNLSMIYGLSLADGLGALLEPEGPPLLAVTDEDGVHHRLWEIRSPARIAALAEVTGSAPVVIADGHHRYTVAASYLDAAGGGSVAGADRIMAFVVPLDPDFLVVRPIHRVLVEVGHDASGIRTLLGEIAEVVDLGPATVDLQDEPEAITFVMSDAVLRVTPRLRDLDRDRLAAEPEALRGLAVVWLHKIALVHLGVSEVVFHHSPAVVGARVSAGAAAAGVLLPPVSVDQIAAVAAAGERMPPKTTFFWPKARTGVVMRRFADQV